MRGRGTGEGECMHLLYRTGQAHYKTSEKQFMKLWHFEHFGALWCPTSGSNLGAKVPKCQSFMNCFLMDGERGRRADNNAVGYMLLIIDHQCSYNIAEGRPV